MTSGRARANDTWKTRSNATVPTAVSATPTSLFSRFRLRGHGRLRTLAVLSQCPRAGPRAPPGELQSSHPAGRSRGPLFHLAEHRSVLRANSFMQAAGGPGTVARGDRWLALASIGPTAREAVRAARAAREGVFNSENPLRVMPFELRFLARRRPQSTPSADDDRLRPPQSCTGIPNVADRLFLPPAVCRPHCRERCRRA